MNATTPRAIDSKGRIQLAQARRHHGPDSPQAASVGARVHFNEASMALRAAYEMAQSAHDAAEIARQLHVIADRFQTKAGAL